MPKKKSTKCRMIRLHIRVDIDNTIYYVLQLLVSENRNIISEGNIIKYILLLFTFHTYIINIKHSCKLYYTLSVEDDIFCLSGW